jgi:hypothetical protein
MAVGGGEEEHLLAGDEGAHLRVEIAEHLIRVKGFGALPVAVPLLQIMLAARAGHGLLADQRGGHLLLLCRITKECRDARCIVDDEMLDAELRAFWKHLAQLGERARQERRLASVMACEWVSAHHGPVDVVGHMLEEVRSVARLQAFEDFANELSGNCLQISPWLWRRN